MCALSLLSGPASEPLTLAELKTHLRLDEFNAEPAPWSAPLAALAGVAGVVDAGAHRYCVTFLTAGGETQGGQESAPLTVVTPGVNGQVDLTSIPLGGSAVISRKLYRTKANGATFYYLGAVADNITTTYRDNTADSALGISMPQVNTTDDGTLTRLLTVARRTVESYTRRCLLTQRWLYLLDDFPASIQLPRSPVQAVEKIDYIAWDGTLTTLDSAHYTVDLYSEPAWVVPAYQDVWPQTRDVLNAVQITFRAGWTTVAEIPAELLLALDQLCAAWYETREAVTEEKLAPIPWGVEQLMDLQRVYSFV